MRISVVYFMIAYFFVSLGVPIDVMANNFDHKRNVAHNQKFTVLYYAFNAESYSGVTMQQLEISSCPRLIQKNVFISLLKNAKRNAEGFNPNDVRAKIMGEGKIYYIDRRGSIKFGDDVVSINKDSFQNALIRPARSNC